MGENAGSRDGGTMPSRLRGGASILVLICCGACPGEFGGGTIYSQRSTSRRTVKRETAGRCLFRVRTGAYLCSAFRVDQEVFSTGVAGVYPVSSPA